MGYRLHDEDLSVTVDVAPVYTNIPYNGGIDAINKSPEDAQVKPI